ncbi:hypothetical protein STENM223S_06080 [Streptomyces tendae]
MCFIGLSEMAEKVPGSLLVVTFDCIQHTIEECSQHEKTFFSPVVGKMPNHAGVDVHRDIVGDVHIDKIESPLAALNVVELGNSHKPPPGFN